MSVTPQHVTNEAALQHRHQIARYRIIINKPFCIFMHYLTSGHIYRCLVTPIQVHNYITNKSGESKIKHSSQFSSLFISRMISLKHFLLLIHQQGHIYRAQLDKKYLAQSRVAHTVDSILPEGHIQLGKPSTQKTILAHMLAAAVFKIPPWYSMPGQVLNQTFKTFSLVLQSLDYTTSIGCWWQYTSGWD